MIRNLKILGLAIAAVMAMSAIMASAAMAEPQFTASAYSATVTGSATKGSEVFTTEAGKVECASHFVSAPLEKAGSTLTVTPSYKECTAFGLNANVTNDGCKYVFHATEKVSAGVYKHHVDVVCEKDEQGKEKPITIIAGGGLCQVDIFSQAGLTTVKTTNLANGTVTVQPEVKNIAYTVTVDGFGCPFTGTGNKTGGEYTGDVVVARVGGGTAEVSGE